jgi:hypothetical protein
MSEKAVEPQHSNMDIESGKESIGHWSMILDQGVVTKEIADWQYDGAGTEEDPYAVEWINNDPRNPMEWPQAKKWVMALAVANSVLVVSFCSSAFSGGTSGKIPFAVFQTLTLHQVSNRSWLNSASARKSSHWVSLSSF